MSTKPIGPGRKGAPTITGGPLKGPKMTTKAPGDSGKGDKDDGTPARNADTPRLTKWSITKGGMPKGANPGC